MLGLSDATVGLREWRADDAPALEPMSGPAARIRITKLRRHRCAGTAVAPAITRPDDDVAVRGTTMCA